MIIDNFEYKFVLNVLGILYNSHINIQFDDLLSDVKSQIIIIIIIIIIGYAKLDLLTRLYLPIKFQNHWTCGMNNLLDVVNKQTKSFSLQWKNKWTL